MTKFILNLNGLLVLKDESKEMFKEGVAEMGQDKFNELLAEGIKKIIFDEIESDFDVENSPISCEIDLLQE